MRTLASSSVIDLWERGTTLHPLNRGLLCLSAAFPNLPGDSFADWPLGQRNSALAECRCAIFGPKLDGWVACPECGEKLEFQMNARELIGPGEEPSGKRIEVRGHCFRLPTTRDLAQVAAEGDADASARRLLDICRLDADGHESWSEEDIDEIGQRMAAADPMAETRLKFHCPNCGHEWRESLDIALFLWAEMDAAAKRLLHEVHTLAAAYGWTEAEILALSDARRSCYLRMVQG